MPGSLLGAAIVLIAALAGAQPVGADVAVGPLTVMPPHGRLVRFVPEAPAARVDPQALMRDPAAFARAVEQRRQALTVDDMEPAQARIVARLLWQGRRVFMAEELLGKAVARWPENGELLADWSHLLVIIGRPNDAAAALEAVRERFASRADIHYVLGKALASIQPPGDAVKARALAAWEKAIELDANYRDPFDSGTAAQVRVALSQLRMNQPVRIPGQQQ